MFALCACFVAGWCGRCDVLARDARDVFGLQMLRCFFFYFCASENMKLQIQNKFVIDNIFSCEVVKYAVPTDLN